jgi:hypothetical protein
MVFGLRIDGARQVFSAAPRSFYNTAPRSFLQPQFFSPVCARARASTGGLLAGRMRMRGVQAASRSPTKSRIRFVAGLGVVRAVLVHLPSTLMGTLRSWGAPGPDPMWLPVTKALLSALFRSIGWTRGIEMCALYGSWACVWVAGRGSVPVLVLVPVLALALVDLDRFPFLFPFTCWCWLLLGLP